MIRRATLTVLLAAVACTEPVGLSPEGYSGPHFQGRVLLDGAPVVGATIRGRTHASNACGSGPLFSQAQTTSDESGEYTLFLDGFAGWGGGRGSELMVACAVLIAESETGIDTVTVPGISVRWLQADTLVQDFVLH